VDATGSPSKITRDYDEEEKGFDPEAQREGRLSSAEEERKYAGEERMEVMDDGSPEPPGAEDSH
jgi:hypothetical protein